MSCWQKSGNQSLWSQTPALIRLNSWSFDFNRNRGSRTTTGSVSWRSDIKPILALLVNNESISAVISIYKVALGEDNHSFIFHDYSIYQYSCVFTVHTVTRKYFGWRNILQHQLITAVHLFFGRCERSVHTWKVRRLTSEYASAQKRH